MTMSKLRDLFHKPVTTPIGGVDFVVYKLSFDLFDDAISLADLIQQLSDDVDGTDDTDRAIQRLQELKADSAERQAINRLLAGSLKVTQGGDTAAIELQPADVGAMPVQTVVEAIAVLVEANVDFFLASLPTLTRVGQKTSTGLALLNNSLAPATS